MLQEQEQSVLTNDILEEVNQLYHAEDIQDQISCCVFIAEKTFELLKMIDKPDENNYKKQVVHLFYQVVKRNYARGKFTKDQISLMTQMIEKSRKPFVCEEEYFELIKENLKIYAMHLERRFQYGIEKKLLNETDCHRAKARIQFQNGRAELPGISCQKKEDFQPICESVGVTICEVKKV